MKFIKSHKILVAVLVVILVMLLAAITLYRILTPDLHRDVYGNRLSEADQHKISEDAISKIKADFEANEVINLVSFHQKGRILNFSIDVTSVVDLVAAKSFADQIVAQFSPTDKSYYDFQVFVTCNENAENELYPLIGYLHKSSSAFVWSVE